jgi:hypothetical protein
VIDLLSARVIVVLLCSSAGLGIFISPRLPPAHRGRETVEMMTFAIGMLVTFAALVLGLITASVKTGYDDAVHFARNTHCSSQNSTDVCATTDPELTRPVRTSGSYTAAAIASIWPYEPPPVRVQYPDTSGMYNLIITGEVLAYADLINHAGLENAGCGNGVPTSSPLERKVGSRLMGSDPPKGGRWQGGAGHAAMTGSRE